MRLLTVNIQHGGGERVPALLETLAGVPADVLVLTEFRENARGARLKAGLRAAGWCEPATSAPPGQTNGVLITARTPVSMLAPPPGAPVGDEARWLECTVAGVSVVGVYFPGKQRKLTYWAWFVAQAERLIRTPRVFVGDFNTGKHHVDEVGATFYGPEYIDRMAAAGYVDAWRHLHPDRREDTWVSPRGNPFRVDHAWLSPALARGLRAADHRPEFRMPGVVTDHAGLLVEFDE